MPLPTEENNLLIYKPRTAVYLDFETILKKTSNCENNLEILQTNELNKHVACVFFSFTKLYKCWI